MWCPGRLGWHRQEGGVSGLPWPVVFSYQGLGSRGEREEADGGPVLMVSLLERATALASRVNLG